MNDLQVRRAFVGMSGPLFYDYRNTALPTGEDTGSSPNPILDSPAALMLLYDEIWFLTRSLCPASMRELPFVHFVMEDDDTLQKLSGFSFDDQAHIELEQDIARYFNSRRFFSNYDANLLAVGASWWGTDEAAIDSHSHGLNLSKIGVSERYAAMATNPRGVFFDQAVLNHLGGEFELVTNSVLQEIIAPAPRNASVTRPSLVEDMSIVDALTLSDLPTRLLKNGPDVDFLGELRGDGCLPAFRDWVRQRSLRASPEEIRDIEREVKATIDMQTKKHFKKLSPGQFALSNYKTILTEGIGLFIPGFTKVMKAVKTYSEWQEVRSGRWSAFLFNAKQSSAERRVSGYGDNAPGSR